MGNNEDDMTISAQAPVDKPALRPGLQSPSQTVTAAMAAYLGFLARVVEVDGHDSAEQEEHLDPSEKALLELVLLRWARRTPLTVRQTIAFAHLGSPATLHKRLIRLRSRHYLQLQDVAGDRRVKQLVPGPHGLAYLEAMGRHLMAARRAPLKTPASP